ncbi:MAG: LCP family protein, partial [Clostridia bacterium]|nr:LCP family protein [Clostridia bacterium]
MATETSKIITVMKVLLAFLLTIAIAGGAAIALYVKSIRDNPNKAFANTVNFQAVDDEGVVHTYNQGVISFLIVGIDSNDEREKRREGYRSDVMMICVIDTDKNQASLISVPRDTKARVQVLNASGKPTKMINTKINASMAYGYGPDKFGYQNTLAAINDLLNSTGVQVNPIQHYIGADMDDFVKIANLMGGVDVELPQNVPGFGSKGETVHLEGEKALTYVRIRSGKGLTGSDTDRTTRQRGFIKAVAMKMQQQGAMKTIPQIYNDAINKGCIQTNLSLDQIYAISASMQDINFEEVVFAMVPGYFKTESGASYWFVNKTDFKQMILDL